MPPCCAFRSTDMRPCANRARPHSDVCHAHRNFYKKAFWLHMFTRQNSRHLLLGFDYGPNTYLGRIQHALEYSLNEEKVVLTEEDVARFYCAPSSEWDERENNLAALFVVMVRTGKVSPQWNVNLTRFCYVTFAKMYRWRNRDVLPAVARWIRPFLEHPDAKPLDVFQTLLLLHRTLVEKQKRNRESADLISSQLIRECLAEPSLRPLTLLSNGEWLTVIEKIFQKGGMYARVATSVKRGVEGELPQARVEAKAMVRGRLDPLKEELVAAMWHPDRVEAWLNAGGFELLDVMMGL